MDIKLHPEVLRQLKLEKPEDIQRLVNDLLFLYMQGDLIRPMHIVKRMKIPRVFIKESDVFDAQTHEFKGVVAGESLWVPGAELRDMLEEYDEIVIINSPRKSGIRRKKTKRSSSKNTVI